MFKWLSAYRAKVLKFSEEQMLKRCSLLLQQERDIRQVSFNDCGSQLNPMNLNARVGFVWIDSSRWWIYHWIMQERLRSNQQNIQKQLVQLTNDDNRPELAAFSIRLIRFPALIKRRCDSLFSTSSLSACGDCGSQWLPVAASHYLLAFESSKFSN